MGFGDAIQGAIGGGMGGAGIGGPVGGAIGAGLGGLMGLFGGNPQDEMNARLQRMNQEFQNRQGPQAGPAAQAGMSSFRGNQADLIGRLEALSQGRGPSLAQQQLQAATDRNVRQQQAMAAGARGPSAAAAQFQAMNNSGMLGAQAAQDAAAARIQEQQMALNQLGLTLHGARGADEEMGRFNTGQTNQMSLANLDAKLRAMGMNDQMRLAILQAQTGMSQGPSLGQSLMAGGASLFNTAATQGGLGQLFAGKGGKTSHEQGGWSPMDMAWMQQHNQAVNNGTANQSVV